jgi:hypothetical protein
VERAPLGAGPGTGEACQTTKLALGGSPHGGIIGIGATEEDLVVPGPEQARRDRPRPGGKEEAEFLTWGLAAELPAQGGKWRYDVPHADRIDPVR